MKISYNWLKDYIKKLPKPEKLAEILTMHSFEVKEINKVGKDRVLDIDILPNRAHDCLSHIGVAKECAALLKLKIKDKKIQPKADPPRAGKTSDFVSVEIKDKELCPRYCARYISGVKVGPSPIWLKDRLEAIGQKSINNIVDVSNYVMLETGQPLHAFDLDKLSGNQIIVRKAKKGEKILTLDNEKYDLDESTLVIADAKEPVAIAGIKGGKKAEISKNTKTIILESANFNPTNIYLGSKKLGLKTEASLRFEHGLDPNSASQAIDRLASLICGIGGGKIARGMVDIYPKQIKPKKIGIRLAKINSVSGINFSEKEIVKIFNLLGFKTKKINQQFLVEVPTCRLDIELPEDLIEEVGRIYGYQKIPSKLPLGALAPAKVDDSLRIITKAKNILESLGLTEVYNYSFVGENDLKKLGLEPKNYIELENPLSSDLKYLRKDLIINLLKNIRDNFRYFSEVRLFELGKVYFKKEKTMLAGIIGSKTSFGSKLFYESKGIVDSLLNKLGISNQWYDDYKATSDWTDKIFWDFSKSAEIKLDDKEIGFFGEINPLALSKFDITGQVAAFYIDFELLTQSVEEELIYEPPSKFPAAVRDIAVLVNLNDRVTAVLNVINASGGKLVQDVDLFDMYEGEEIPEGKKNLAFHIIYQAQDRTLTDDEVDGIHEKIVHALERRGWEVRK